MSSCLQAQPQHHQMEVSEGQPWLPAEWQYHLKRHHFHVLIQGCVLCSVEDVVVGVMVAEEGVEAGAAVGSEPGGAAVVAGEEDDDCLLQDSDINLAQCHQVHQQLLLQA